MFQHKSVSEQEEMNDLSSDHSKQEAKKSPPEKSDIEKLKESLQEREEKEADLKQALKIAETERQQYRTELDAMKTELETVKNRLQELSKKISEKSKDITSLKGAVSQHSSDIIQVSKDLTTKSLEEAKRSLVSQENTTKRIGQVQSSIKSEIRTHMQAQIPVLQKELAQQLRDERKTEMSAMKKEMSDVQCEVLKQHEEREGVSFILDVSQNM